MTDRESDWNWPRAFAHAVEWLTMLLIVLVLGQWLGIVDIVELIHGKPEYRSVASEKK